MLFYAFWLALLMFSGERDRTGSEAMGCPPLIRCYFYLLLLAWCVDV